jgi:hypothetical protein
MCGVVPLACYDDEEEGEEERRNLFN